MEARCSANAYAFATTYQNCNQWIVELLAAAWADTTLQTRHEAQSWLLQNAYTPSAVRLPHWWLYMLPWFTPLMNNDDQPAAASGVYEVSTPEAIEAFAHHMDPDASRIEVCITPGDVIIHHGWSLLDKACTAEDGDQASPY